MNKLLSLILSGALAGGVVITSTAAPSVTQRGASQLQLDARGPIDPAEIAPETTGEMRLQFRDNSKVRMERIQIQAAGMAPDSPVSLTAAVDTDVNVQTILNATTDSNGRVNFDFQSKTPAPTRQPRGQEPIPETMSPLTRVRAICLENSSVQVIGFAWLVNSTTYKYIVRRNLTPAEGGSAEGSIKLIANQTRVNFTLMAGGLTPDAEYVFVLNGAATATATADSSGIVRLRGWPDGGPAPLEVRTLALAESGGTVVLSTNLPGE